MSSTEKLDQAVSDYLLWMIDQGYSPSTWSFYKRVLERYVKFAGDMEWETVFSKETMADFGRECRLVQFEPPIRGLARYLYRQRKIPHSFDKKKRDLPAVYEQYLRYYKKTRQVCDRQVLNTLGILDRFATWSAREKLKLPDLTIEQVDCFLAEMNNRFSPRYRSVLRGLLAWLYQEKTIRRNLAPLLKGGPQYAQPRPPRFLRPEEVRKLFSIRPQTPCEYRTWAMLHLAFFLGLRPREVSLITLDDIRFSTQEIRLTERKSCNPINLVLPDPVIKAITSYIIGIRPETNERHLFLRLLPPHDPVSGSLVSRNITAWMRRAGTSGSAYWLRHT